jgi:hypothetical protein
MPHPATITIKAIFNAAAIAVALPPRIVTNRIRYPGLLLPARLLERRILFRNEVATQILTQSLAI